jgi:hypothetical protein
LLNWPYFLLWSGLFQRRRIEIARNNKMEQCGQTRLQFWTPIYCTPAPECSLDIPGSACCMFSIHFGGCLQCLGWRRSRMEDNTEQSRICCFPLYCETNVLFPSKYLYICWIAIYTKGVVMLFKSGEWGVVSSSGVSGTAGSPLIKFQVGGSYIELPLRNSRTNEEAILKGIGPGAPLGYQLRWGINDTHIGLFQHIYQHWRYAFNRLGVNLSESWWQWQYLTQNTPSLK